MANSLESLGTFLDRNLKTDFKGYEIAITEDTDVTRVKITNAQPYNTLSFNGTTPEVQGPYGCTIVILEVRGDALTILESSGTPDHRASAIFLEDYIRRQHIAFSRAA